MEEEMSKQILDDAAKADEVMEVVGKPGIPTKIVVALVLAILPYFDTLRLCLPCLLNPRSCVWSEGFVFTYILSFLAVPVDIISLILGIIALVKSKKYQKQSTIRVLATIAIILSVAYFAVNFLMVDLVHMTITGAGGY